MKFENKVFIFFCSHLLLYLKNIGCVSAEYSNKFDVLRSTFTIFVITVGEPAELEELFFYSYLKLGGFFYARIKTTLMSQSYNFLL